MAILVYPSVQVFASLLEYATVGYLGKRIAMRKSRAQQQAQTAAKEKEGKKEDEVKSNQNQVIISAFSEVGDRVGLAIPIEVTPSAKMLEGLSS